MKSLNKEFLPFCDHEYANTENCVEVAEDFAIEFGRWIIQNEECTSYSSWSEETAKYYLKKFKDL
jgi:hypothetical protein